MARNKTIIAVWNRGGKGKTSTLKLLAQLLLNKYPRCKKIYPIPFHLPSRGEYKIVIKVGRTVLGIITQGDPMTGLRGKLREMRQHKCDLIFCATRMKGDTVKAVEDMYLSHGYQNIWTSTYEHHDRLIQPVLNTIKAKHLYDLAKRLRLI